MERYETQEIIYDSIIKPYLFLEWNNEKFIRFMKEIEEILYELYGNQGFNSISDYLNNSKNNLSKIMRPRKKYINLLWNPGNHILILYEMKSDLWAKSKT